MDDHETEATALEFQDRLAGMSDDDVRAEYLASDGEPGDPWVDSRAAALEKRNIDI